MRNMDKLRREFISPADEFTPVPFWFWNDTLTKKEIRRQINDFYNKGVMGFVIHPRIGIPRSIGYLSDRFMRLVKAAVEEASRLGMTVVLYDEGMYPSGSAHGMVVEDNPEYASRALKLIEYRYSGQQAAIPGLAEGERLVSVQLVKKISDTAIDPSATIKLEVKNGVIGFPVPAGGNSAAGFFTEDCCAGENPSEENFTGEHFSVLFFIETYSCGTIRGIHFGEDSREPGAPKSADILNPDAVQKFIRLTHERYYSFLKKYFGNTIKAMFTDEPSTMGRYPLPGLMPWTGDFLELYIREGNLEEDLGALWFYAGSGTEEKRKKFRKAIANRLETAYYGQISQWCTQHGIALVGHPSESDEIGLLSHFHIPGQDLIGRYAAPEAGKAIEGKHSTMAKCTSDAARHAGKRRNANECFGVCYRGNNSWDLPAGDMKWFMDWLFIRGVNMLFPHAFYYSIKGKRAYERPPDVGPNNIWWPEYKTIAAYIKRFSWLMTDSTNAARIAVLCRDDGLPWEIVKPLYQRQIEFNYLQADILLSDGCMTCDGQIKTGNQGYGIVLVGNPEIIGIAAAKKLQDFINDGGKVIVYNPEKKFVALQGYTELNTLEEIVTVIDRFTPADVRLHPENRDLRVSHVVKDDIHFYACVNESEQLIEGNLSLSVRGRIEKWDPWKGSIEQIQVYCDNDSGIKVHLSLERRESIIFCVDPSSGPAEIASSIESVENAVPIAPAENEPFEIIPSIKSAIAFQAGKLAKAVTVSDTISSNEIRKTSGYSSHMLELKAGWLVKAELEPEYTGRKLESWTRWKGMKHFSGMASYVNSFSLPLEKEIKEVRLELGNVCETARVYVNDIEAGVKMWAPYKFDITEQIKPGINTIRIEVTNSLANKYNKAELCSGLVGPVRIEIF